MGCASNYGGSSCFIPLKWPPRPPAEVSAARISRPRISPERRAIIPDHFAHTVPLMPCVRATSEFRSRLTGGSRFPKSEP
jgi:hypothetical protein